MRIALASKKIVWLLGILIVFAVGIFAARWGLDKIEDHKELALLNEKIDEIIAFTDIDQVKDFHEKTDKLRILINDHSDHDIDDEFYAVWGNHRAFADELLKHLKGERADTPNMECSTRSNLLGQILERDENYDIRNVVLYTPDKNLQTHRVIEIRNPETGRWETQDTDYDVYWKNASTGERTSLAQVTADIDGHIPCGRHKCSWSHRSREGSEADIMKHYAKIITIHDKEAGKRFSLYAPDVDPDRVYEQYEGKKGTFCEIYARNCEDGFLPAAEYKEY